jgi:hypothetical protein
LSAGEGPFRRGRRGLLDHGLPATPAKAGRLWHVNGKRQMTSDKKGEHPA